MRLSAWLHELSYEEDTDLRLYFKYGITYGFLIVDCDSAIDCYHCSNYSPTLQGEEFRYVDSIIHEEMSQGKYIISDDIPHCVHSLGAVPKKDGAFRVITDCKRPLGLSINNYMDDTTASFLYNSVDNVTEMMYPGAYMATVDNSSAYRPVGCCIINSRIYGTLRIQKKKATEV